MKIVVIGGTGLIGSKTVAILRQGGHEVVAASPNSGVNTITGEGLKEAVAGAQVVIDLANSPSFEDKAVLEFFETSGRNLLAAEAAAGVRHHVALSIVGTDRTPDNGYFRAKVAQEKLIETSGIPYTIIRSTQFLEFLGGIAASGADGNMVRISPGLFQPIAADDVAAIVADVALAAPRKRHRRDRRPGTSTVQRNRRPLSEGGRRPARGRERPRGPILRRSGRGALARAARRRAPRHNRPRGMAAPTASESLNQPSQRHGRQAIVRRILCALTLAAYPIGGVPADAQTSAAEIAVHGATMPRSPSSMSTSCRTCRGRA